MKPTVLIMSISFFPQNQGHFWKEEGVKALGSKDYNRAIKLLSIALQFPNNSAELSYLVNNSLATAYFETKQYIKAVEKGRECFKFKPTKSQVPLLSDMLNINKTINLVHM